MKTASTLLWSASSLLVATGTALAVTVGITQGPQVGAWIGFLLLLSAELMLLAVTLLTLASDDAFGGVDALAELPPVLAWPLRAGWWIGGGIAALVTVFGMFTTVGGVSAGTRFAVSVMSVIAMLAAMFATPGLPAWTLPALVIVGAVVIVIATVRGTVGMIAKARRR